MSEKKKIAPGARALGRVFLSAVLWAGTFVIAVKLLRHYPGNLGIRVGAVALAILGFLTWPVSLARLIRAQGEFERRIQLVALAIAFLAVALFVFTANMLQIAGFIYYVSLQTIWLVMFFTWFAAVLVTSWYYR